MASPKVITKPKFAVGLLLAFDGYPLMMGEFAPVVSGVFKSVIMVSKSFVNLPLCELNPDNSPNLTNHYI